LVSSHGHKNNIQTPVFGKFMFFCFQCVLFCVFFFEIDLRIFCMNLSL
jgi:hypothetical protein